MAASVDPIAYHKTRDADDQRAIRIASFILEVVSGPESNSDARAGTPPPVCSSSQETPVRTRLGFAGV
jgi:hypothetical protein